MNPRPAEVERFFDIAMIGRTLSHYKVVAPLVRTFSDVSELVISGTRPV